MTPPTTDRRHLVKALWLTFWYLVFPLGCFVIGFWGYSKEQFIDYQLQTLAGNNERLCLPLLLFLPIGMLIITMVVLVFRSRRDHDSDRFYSFCLLVMSVTPISYCVLWGLYVHEVLNEHLMVLSIGAFILIIILVVLVVYLTYVMMWNPERPSYALSVPDITDWDGFCVQLQQNSIGSSAPNSFSLVSLFQDENLRAAIRDKKIGSGQRHDVIDALNGLFSWPNLYQAQDFNKVNNPAPNGFNSSPLIQEYNRNLFDRVFAGVLKEQGRFYKMWRGPQGWLARQHESLKTGVTKSPFWAIVFFFATFLGVTYLFAFAFAFHDKATLRNEHKPSLFSPRSSLYNVGEYPVSQTGSGENGQNQSVTTSQESQSAGSNRRRWPEYFFYFDSYSGNPRFKDSFDQQRLNELLTEKNGHEQAEEELRKGGLNNLQRRDIEKKRLSKLKLKEINDNLSLVRGQWREWKNQERLDRLVNAIVWEDKATHGEGLLIQVRGSADDKQPKATEGAGVNYPSNYTLSEARAQAITYALRERLARRDNLQSNFQWVILPLSNEDLSVPLSPEDVQAKQLRGNPETNAELTMLEMKINGVPVDSGVKANQKDSLSSYLNKIQKLTVDKRVDNLVTQRLTEKLQSYLQLISQIGNSTREESDANNETLRQVKADLEEALAVVEYDLIDRDEAKRSVVVTIRPAQQNQTHLFAPLSLMDYMYFTIYTITTTGYGDIVPSTTYAKFLCSAANILEVFFFVVFFNGLLSMTQSRASSVGEEEPSPSNPGPSAKQTVTDFENHLSRIETLVQKNEELLKEVQSATQKISARQSWWPWRH